MTKRFYEVLVKIFNRFDIDGDGCFGSKELNSFYEIVNGKPIDSETIQFLKFHFEHKKGNLTLTGKLLINYSNLERISRILSYTNCR
jgi:hypothetical protein